MFLSKTFVIVTGASKGFGRAVSCSLAREFSRSDDGKNSVLVLVALPKDGLEETKRAVTQICSDLTVHLFSEDLADVKSLPDLIMSMLGIVDSSQFTCAVLINNAASIGKPNSITKHTALDKIQAYMDLNITSSIYLTTHFMNYFVTAKKYVINISSLCGVQATPSLSLYCAGKAARDMFNKVLALESKDTRVLNYAPGPLETEMFDDILNNSDSDEVKKMFVEMKTEKKVLAPATSADKLMVLLKQDRYTSGAHVDYFDELP